MKLGAPPVRRGSLQGPGTALVVPQQPQNQRGPYRLRGAFAQSDQVLANEYQFCSGKPWLRRKRWRGCGRSPAGAEARRDFAPFSARHPEGTRSCPDTRPRPRRRVRECRGYVDIHQDICLRIKINPDLKERFSMRQPWSGHAPVSAHPRPKTVPPLLCRLALKLVAQRDFQDAGVGRGGDLVHVRITDADVRVGRVGVVEKIERLGAELKVVLLRDVELLEEA